MTTDTRYRAALTIAGSDSGGGAGIQADIKTFSAIGVYATSVITAVTAQNTMGVRDILPIPPAIIQSQLEAVVSDIQIDAVKIGMLHATEIVTVVAQTLQQYNPSFIVLDPVMVATSGDRLIEDDCVKSIVSQLFPLATLITPNTEEATVLTGISIQCKPDMEQAAQQLITMGAKAVLLKGGHLVGADMSDLLQLNSGEKIWLSTPTIETKNTHGTGCTLSSAITAYLAQGKPLVEAVQLGKTYISNAIKAGATIQLGKGRGPVNHFFNPQPLLITT